MGNLWKPKWFLFGIFLCIILIMATLNTNFDVLSKWSRDGEETETHVLIRKTTAFRETAVDLETDMPTVCRTQPQRLADCKKLYRGENTTISVNVGLMKLPQQCRLENIVQNCSLLRLAHGYGQAPVTQEEKDFPIAFSLKVHTDAGQVEQLLRTMYRPHNIYCIHVDKKASSFLHQIIFHLGKCFDNIHVIQNPINLVYASSAHVRVELKLMELCLDQLPSWKYYINLAGQDFPLKTNLEMVEILKQLKGQNDIESFYLLPFKRKRLLREVEVSGNNVITTNKTKENFQYDIELRKGSTYGIFSRPFVKFLLQDDIAQLFLKWSSDITPSEEIVWATLNYLPWAPGGYDVEIRHVDGYHLAKAVLWSLDSDSCQGKVVRSVCVYGAGDLPWLKDRHELFANKFDHHFDPVPLDCLEHSLRERSTAKDTTQLQWFRYRHLRQVLNQRFEEFISKNSSPVQYLMDAKRAWLQNNH